jgi:hypothetical protein
MNTDNPHSAIRVQGMKRNIETDSDCMGPNKNIKKMNSLCRVSGALGAVAPKQDNLQDRVVVGNIGVMNAAALQFEHDQAICRATSQPVHSGSEDTTIRQPAAYGLQGQEKLR